MVLDVDGARRPSSCSTYGRAVEVGGRATGQALGARLVGEGPADRVGHREDPAAAGPQHPAHLAHAPAPGRRRTAPRRTPSRPGRRSRPRTAAPPASACTSGTARPAAAADAQGVLQLPVRRGRGRPGGRPGAASQREHWAAPAPISRTSGAFRSAAGPSSPASASSRPSGPQTKRSSPRKAPCSAWYSSALPVPPAAVGPAALRLAAGGATGGRRLGRRGCLGGRQRLRRGRRSPSASRPGHGARRRSLRRA